MDNLHGADNSVAVRCSYFLYNGRTDPYSARNCCYRSAVACHSRAKGSVGSEIR